MKLNSLLLILMFSLTSIAWAQAAPSQAPAGPSSGSQMGPEQRQHMMETHKQEMEAMSVQQQMVRSGVYILT